ncbi:aldehyde dehydrogenase (NADP(+)) [Rhodococcus sp. WS3]|uniref:aldehyde dehydrogenase (NADP(+)) n=1 Tax=unclassified Rhodococcus (in: high G+C Gram-positive bacteria) TaxID=192944 RepID=UPI0005D3D3EA|nr:MULTISPECIES: aldehyde dehydrogenase (NADP(+)) [unclassified Rhodococcus (in: high G+C Gram-positive bacteria)]KJF19323.1 NADP-dependent fatty aldehyde dehydrogenase [Rhodococcus sp. AD45]ROZ42725.1 aldehyde dehydrogenase (NADP(+)) [Rhodococcus sp. WS3]RZL21787.1 MAG: aldehyde dehydrogenase (NADP(+)) [Rhodococcus sp. (in: high G+C Gram-positive bacteria)]
MNTTVNDLDGKVEAAHAAYGKAKVVAPETRALWLETVAAGLDDDSSVLVEIASRETNLGIVRLQGELRRTTFQLRLFADELRRGEHLDATIDHADDAWGMGPRPDIRRFNIPLGVVGVFGASNFPFAFSVMGGDSASALAAGCAVVHKAHDGHLELASRTADVVFSSLDAVGAPAGLFSLVVGRPAAEALVDHPLVKAIGFTGSTAGGRALFDRASARPEPIPFYGELGGVNAVFVTENAWTSRCEDILAGFAQSFTLGMGQFCTKPGLLFVPAGTTEHLTTTLVHSLDGFTPTPLLNDRLHDGYRTAVDSIRSDPGVETVVDGDFTSTPTPIVFRTTAERVRENPELLRQEMFGPASLVVEYGAEDDLVSLAELLEGQLTTTLQAEPADDVSELTARLIEVSGRVLWNGWPTGVTVSYGQHHGGPYPATTSTTTSVGTAAIRRFLRPVAYQSFPETRLPEPVQDANPWGIAQRVDGQWIRPQRARIQL